MTAWLLEQVVIEGLRGINNEGDPLVLNFKPDAVNSIFAPNAVGKSSIYDALSFAIRGNIKKLDDLPWAEKGKEYYRNRFHSTGLGFVELHLVSTSGQQALVRCALDALGNRVVTSPNHSDPQALLSSLDREFALLDYATFQRFIEAKPTDRGRSFSGLLGLDAYSQAGQRLQALSNTLAFRNKFQLTLLEQQIAGKQQVIGSNRVLAHKVAASALGKAPSDFADFEQIASEIEAALSSTNPLVTLCKGLPLGEVDLDACLKQILEAEGGEKRTQYLALLSESKALEEITSKAHAATEVEAVISLAEAWDSALAQTLGQDRLDVFLAAEKVLSAQEWSDKSLCPACEEVGSKSVLDFVREKISLFQAAKEAAAALSNQITKLGWQTHSDLEKRFLESGEEHISSFISGAPGSYQISKEVAIKIAARYEVLRSRLIARTNSVTEQIATLESELPDSLVAVTNLVRDAQTISSAIKAATTASDDITAFKKKKSKIDKLKDFLDGAAATFSKAESAATQRRLDKVQPTARALFTSVMSDDVLLGVKKPGIDQSLTIVIDSFFGKPNLSALALLSESYRNAFAISLYLAAASLYGGGAKFVVLDDVTSSFDGGHQFHLMETIKTKLARPMVSDGLQIVILSHDTLLEKLFQKNIQSPDWRHQKIEGVPSLIVTPTLGGDAKILDVTKKQLALGKIDDAARGIRMILEGKLLEIIARVKIPVPLDFAISDHKKMADNALKAIREAIALHKAAGTLKMSAQQQTNFTTTAIATIGNFLSHYETGTISTFTSAALNQVLTAIDDLGKCFQIESAPGSGNWNYFKALDKVI